MLPVLDGMRHLAALSARFGEDRVLGGVAFVMTTLDADGDIRRPADLRPFTYGARSGADPERLGAVHEALSGAGFDTVLSSDILGQMWAKWVVIASMSAVATLMRGTIGEVADQPGGIGFATAVVAE